MSQVFARVFRYLKDLFDVAISNPTDGQVLKYNTSQAKWKNATPAIADTPGLQAALDASLSATNISGGMLNDARLSSNVPLKNGTNTFTATNTFNSNIQLNSSGTQSVPFRTDLYNGQIRNAYEVYAYSGVTPVYSVGPDGLVSQKSASTGNRVTISNSGGSSVFSISNANTDSTPVWRIGDGGNNYINLYGNAVFRFNSDLNFNYGSSNYGLMSLTGSTGVVQIYNTTPAAATQLSLRSGATQTGVRLLKFMNNSGSEVAFVTESDAYFGSFVQKADAWAGDSTGLKLQSSSTINWGSSTWYGTLDAGIKRTSSGTLQITNGSSGYGSLFTGTYYVSNGNDGMWNANGVNLKNTGQFSWSSTTNGTVAADVGLSRSAAGTAKVTDGSSGYGSLDSGNLTVSGLGTQTATPVTVATATKYDINPVTTATFNIEFDAGYSYNSLEQESYLYSYVSVGGGKFYTANGYYLYNSDYSGDQFRFAGTLTEPSSVSGVMYFQWGDPSAGKDLGTATSFFDNGDMTDLYATGTLYQASTTNQGFLVTYDIYSYKTISGTTVYASTPKTVTVTESSAPALYYVVQVSWTATAGSTGYLVRRSRNGVVSWTTTGATTLVDGAVNWTTAALPNMSIQTYYTNSISLGGVVVTAKNNLVVNGTATAFAFAGMGSALTGIDAANISTGFLPDARLSSNIPLKNNANTFTSSQSVSYAGTYNVFTLGQSGGSGALSFYKSANTLAVNEANTSPGNASQFAYHWTSGNSSKNVVFCIARTGVSTAGFGYDATNFDFYSESASPNFRFKKSVGFGSTVSSSGTTVATIDGSGNCTLIGSIIATGKQLAYAAKTTSYTLTANDYLVTVSGVITITLPTAVGVVGRHFIIKKIDSGTTTTIATTSSQTIDGAAPGTLTTQWQVLRVISNGAAWLTF